MDSCPIAWRSSFTAREALHPPAQSAVGSETDCRVGHGNGAEQAGPDGIVHKEFILH